MLNISKIKMPNNDILNIKDNNAIHIDDMNTINLSGYDVGDVIPQSLIDKIQDWSVLKYNNDFYLLQSKTDTTFVFTSAMTSSSSVQGKRLVIAHSEGTYTLDSVDTISSGSGGEILDLTSYDIDDILPEEIASKLNASNIVKYNSDYYRLSKEYTDTSTQAKIKLFESIHDVDGGNGLVIRQDSDSSEWTYGGIIRIMWARYNDDNQLIINVENDDSSFLVQDSLQTIRLYKNYSQSDDNITLQFPHTSGTIALLSDISAVQDPTYTQVVTALGFVPYDSTNPNHYINTVTYSNVVSALGYTPYDATNPNGYISGITKSNVTTALGYTPYNSTNPNGYISGITSSDVTEALGYIPYDNSNPENYVTSNTANLTNYYNKTQIDGMVSNRFQALIVNTLPSSGISTSTIYMILQAGQEDVYDQYMYISDAWVKIGTTSINMDEYTKTVDLHNVAITGAYSSLIGKPTIPTDTGDLTNSIGYITKSVNNLDNYTTTENLAAVATTGNYNDLNNKPAIPSMVSQLANDSDYLNPVSLQQQNVSLLINDANYATLNDIEVLQEIDVDEIKRAIAITENIGTVTRVTGGTGLTGDGTTTVTINHANSVEAKSDYPTGTILTNGGSFTIRDTQYDSEGHITRTQDRVITMEEIPAYDDTNVRELISENASDIFEINTELDEIEQYKKDVFTSFQICMFGIEPYIDPNTLEEVSGRYYQRSDCDTGNKMDNYKIDVILKSWLKYHFGIEDQEWLKNITVYVYEMGDHGEYVNHMVTYWSQMSNPHISSYPELQQVGCFIDDGYGSVHKFSTTQVGAILSSNEDGYVSADPTGTGKGYVSGWNTLKNRVGDLEDRPQYNPSESSPLMDGTASVGTSVDFARADHKHPTDTSREATSNKVSSWSGTPGNTKYPTEKLVKDTTDALDTRLTALEESKSVIYISLNAPSSSLGNNGDVYIQI